MLKLIFILDPEVLGETIPILTYISKKWRKFIIMVVYVDDLIITSTRYGLIKEEKDNLCKNHFTRLT
jgi:hypothetical protein